MLEVAGDRRTLHRSKRGFLDSGDAALHRSAGSSTELAALDSPDAPSSDVASPPSVSGKAADNTAAARHSCGGLVTELQSTACDQHEPIGLSPFAMCVLPSSQQSSATAGPDELRAPGPESEPRVQQASSRSRFAAAACSPPLWDDRGCTAAARGGSAPTLHEVAAYQHPRLPSRGRRAHADIVCDVQFSAGGDLIATAGVGKQVSLRVPQTASYWDSLWTQAWMFSAGR